jgi:predicted transcriptional regulator
MATTIKVSEDLRDRLNARARAADLTVAQVLEKLIAADERAARWEAIRQARARTTPAQWAEYEEETRIFDRASDEDLAAYDPLP